MSSRSEDFEAGSSDLLFVYGTLMKGYKLHRYLQAARAEYVRKGRIRAQLYQLENQEYPGAVPSESGHVEGEIYRMLEPKRTLRILDRLEGCDEGLFERRLTEVRVERNKRYQAWTYFYRQSLTNAQEVGSGNYRRV